MRIAAVQMDIVWEQPIENLRTAATRIAEAADAGADLVVLPEMFSTGFSMKTAKTAEPAGGPIERFCGDQARRHGLHLLGTKAARFQGEPQNAALLFGPDGKLAAYQGKVHPFTFAGEHQHFRAADELSVTPVGSFRLATAICYDLRFPELFRALALGGADLIVVPANWPRSRMTAWSQLLIARAIENQCYVVGVNRVGRGGGLDYDGRSAIIDPLGEVLATARGTEQLVVADLDPDHLADVRERFPFLPDARQDLFPSLWPPKIRDPGN
jgi:predicted amidohydrolase